MQVEITSLDDHIIDQLIADHWRELKGLLKEKQRRNELSYPNKEPLDNRHRDGWAP